MSIGKWKTFAKRSGHCIFLTAKVWFNHSSSTLKLFVRVRALNKNVVKRHHLIIAIIYFMQSIKSKSNDMEIFLCSSSIRISSYLDQKGGSDVRAFEPSPKARSLGRFLGKLGSLEARTTKLGRLDEPKEWQKNSTFWHFFAVFPI